jgi:hypothetical protein
MEMLRRFRNGTALSLDATPRRTVANLLDGAARRRAERQRQEAARRADEEARRESAQALARERRLAQLARDEEAAWARVEALIATRKPAEYDAAVTLLDDLRSLAARDARPRDFTRRYTTLRRSHARKPSLLGRMDRANL